MVRFKKSKFERLRVEYNEKIDRRLRAILMDLGEHIAVTMQSDPITLTCLNRTVKENDLLNGYRLSAHLCGRAADIRVWNYSDPTIEKIRIYLEQTWGPLFLFFKHHNSGSGDHIHLNIRWKFASPK